MPNNILCKSFIKFPLSDKPSPVNKPPDSFKPPSSPLIILP